MDLTREPQYRTDALAHAVALGKARHALTVARDALHEVAGHSDETEALAAVKASVRESFRVLQASLPEEDHAAMAAVYGAAAKA